MRSIRIGSLSRAAVAGGPVCRALFLPAVIGEVFTTEQAAAVKSPPDRHVAREPAL